MALLMISYQLPWWGFNYRDYDTNADGEYEDYDDDYRSDEEIEVY